MKKQPSQLEFEFCKINKTFKQKKPGKPAPLTKGVTGQ